MIKAALVAELPTAKDAWLSFGFADPSLNRTDMIGSDVVVAGASHTAVYNAWTCLKALPKVVACAIYAKRAFG
jgi:hypothetical protein